MAKDEKKYCCEWVSILLRIAMVTLFVTAGVHKWINGAGNSAAYIQQMFQGTSFPHWIVLLYSWGIPYIEVTLGAWFLFGFGLRTAWFVMGLYMASLGFGANVAGQVMLAGVSYLAVLFAAAGIWFSGPDDWKFGIDFAGLRSRK
jgi:uncharacterized membrane protein YphA (DoxX/SURF4 family)